MSELVAKSISHIFSPIIAWPIFLIMLLYQQPASIWLPVLIFEFVIPTIVFSIFMKLKLVSDIEITQVKERRLFFCLLVVAHVISLGIIWWLATDQIAELRLIGLLIQVVGIVVTFFWKISAHLAANSFVIAVIMFSAIGGGWQWWPLLFILPVVAWARVVRKKHTVMQTIAGGILPFVIVMVYEYAKGI